jgi:hypothetical protein
MGKQVVFVMEDTIFMNDDGKDGRVNDMKSKWVEFNLGKNQWEFSSFISFSDH